MKKRLLITLSAVLVLILLLPSTVLASKPVLFSATGSITSISDGAVEPAGESGRWVIVEREITGIVDGDVNGDFILRYSGNVDAAQVGNIHGTISIGQYILKMNGQTQIIAFLPINLTTYIIGINISGHWTIVQGARGQGDLDATLYFITDGTHILSIYPYPLPPGYPQSSFSLTGQWQP